GRACEPFGRRTRDRAAFTPECDGVRGVELADGIVVPELRIRRPFLLYLERAARRQRARLEAGAHPWFELLEVGERLVAHEPLTTGVLGDDVWRVAPVLHDAVNARALVHMLAQETDADLRDRQRVGRVETQLREARGVRALAVVMHLELRHREAHGFDVVEI